MKTTYLINSNQPDGSTALVETTAEHWHEITASGSALTKGPSPEIFLLHLSRISAKPHCSGWVCWQSVFADDRSANRFGCGRLAGKIHADQLLCISDPIFPDLHLYFPVQAKFENRIRDNLKNAFLMSWQSFGYSIVLVLICATFVLLTFFFQPFVGLLIVCGVGLYGYVTSAVFVQIFRRYLPEELETDMEKNGLSQLQP